MSRSWVRDPLSPPKLSEQCGGHRFPPEADPPNRRTIITLWNRFYGKAIGWTNPIRSTIYCPALKNMNRNIDYWEKIVKNPSNKYQEYFDAEKIFLKRKVTKNAFVCDVCCGNGRSIEPLLEQTKNIVGIDYEPSAVKNAQKKFRNQPKVKILLANALNIPFANKTFDFVTMSGTLTNFRQNKVAVLQEMARVLKNKGKIIVSIYSEDAFDARMKMYKRYKIPIKKIEGTTFIFDESLGANVSEQFSKEEIIILANKAGLKMTDCIKIKGLMYICEFTKSE